MCHKQGRLNFFIFFSANPTWRSHREVVIMRGKKYPHVQLKSRARPVGFPYSLIISIYSRSAFRRHTCLGLMMPCLTTELEVLGLHLTWRWASLKEQKYFYWIGCHFKSFFFSLNVKGDVSALNTAYHLASWTARTCKRLLSLRQKTEYLAKYLQTLIGKTLDSQC